MWPTSALLALRVAVAAPDCAALDEPAFRSYVLDAQASIDRGDVELPAAILAEVLDQLPCLTFAPAPRMWADLLVAWAIVEFSRGGDWEGPLASALRIRPMIDRGVGPGHPLARWDPPDLPPSGPPVPSGVRMYVDGFPAPTMPPSAGTYLVQKTDGRFWNTVLVRDTALPVAWAAEPVDQPARIQWWTRLGGSASIGAFEQTTSWASDFYPSTSARHARVGAVLDLQATFFSPVGLVAHGSATYATSLWLDGFVALAVAPGHATLGAGVGSASVSTLENQFADPAVVGPPSQQLERVRQLRYPLGTVGYRSTGRSRWDASLALGASPALVRYEAGAGLLLPPVSGALVRVGLALDGRRAVYRQVVSARREVVVGGVQLGLRLDWVAGEY
jgi:hypothetical protein